LDDLVLRSSKLEDGAAPPALDPLDPGSDGA
jgi:hypothetical protein